MQIRMKLAVIAVLILILTIPLFMITSKIYERDSYRNQARDDIARSWTGEQKVLGPVLVVPYTRVDTRQQFDDKLKQYVTRRLEVEETLIILPDTLIAEFRMKTEIRYRGIYEVPVYSGSLTMSGRLSGTKLTELRQRHDVTDVGSPYLSIVAGDVRGITSSPELNWGAETLTFKPGSKLWFGPRGIHAPVEVAATGDDDPVPFSVSLDLRGISSLHFTPVGQSNSIDIASNWPHPKFEGLCLPGTAPRFLTTSWA